jgi:hypothetical protein
VGSPCRRLAASGAGLDFGAIVRQFLPGLLAAHPELPKRKQRLLQRMALCRSGALGSTLYQCSCCGYSQTIPLGCGDRHCPSCQASRSRDWLERQCRSLLPVPHFHVVFTLPQQLHPLLLRNQAVLYKLLFDCAAASLLAFARQRLDGTPGITAILHTWGQQLNYHPHLHCIITAGALSEDGQTWSRPKQKRYLFPAAALSALFRGKFMASVRRLQARLRCPQGLSFTDLRTLYDQHWQVNLKRPFGGPQQALAYLAHYTHRVAIANSRLQHLDPQAGTVRFAYRDYADGHRIKSRQLPGTEFLSRFCRHLLPPHFTRIRHYGLLANNRKHRDIPQARLLLLSRRSLSVLLALQAGLNAAPQTQLCPRCQAAQWKVLRVIRPLHSHRCRPP